MKHINWKSTLWLAVIALALGACKDDKDDDGGGKTYPSDGLTVEAKQNVMVANLTNTNCGDCIPTLEAIAVLKARYPGRIVPFSIHTVDTLASPAGVLLYTILNDDAGNPNKLFVNGVQTTDNQYAYDYVDGIVNAPVPMPPVLAVNNTVRENDTAWIVYPKIQFYEDNARDFYVQSFIVATNITAQDHGFGYNLLQTSNDSRVQSSGSTTTWVANGGQVDSLNYLFHPGDVYRHIDVPIGYGASDTSFYGTPLENINPIGRNYFAGDVFGNQYSPIEIYVKKPVNNMPQLVGAKLMAVTIVLERNNDTPPTYTFINGCYTNL